MQQSEQYQHHQLQYSEQQQRISSASAKQFDEQNEWWSDQQQQQLIVRDQQSAKQKLVEEDMSVRTHSHSHAHSPTSLHPSPAISVSPVCSVPVRDAASLKAIRYGPGHEKFPSWGGESAPSTAQPARSKSWTDHTNYPKEQQQPLARPKPPPFTQQLKTVMERCEKLPAEVFEGGRVANVAAAPPFLPRLDREGKVLGDCDYSVPSPPERDPPTLSRVQPQLTQADLEEYARSYQEPQYSQIPTESHLTRAELEQYTRAYEDSNSLRPSHQTQASYAQSEGYHSYVSSTDSTTTTPFLDRLRRDSEAVGSSVRCGVSSNSVDDSRHESSASSGSSSETLKWHGSLSDVSIVSGSSSSGVPQTQAPAAGLIAHSARVPPPQRHLSESVLYLGVPPWVQRNNQINNQMRRLFPVSTYTVQPNEPTSPRSPPALSVAERINELERQQRLNCLEKDKHSVTDHAALKAIQKKALLSFYERHHSAWKSEPQLNPPQPQSQLTAPQPQMTAPQPPHSQPPPPLRPKPPSSAQQPSRRSSSASDYAGAAWREMVGANKESRPESGQREIRHQHSSSCGSLSTAVLGPIIVGPSISVDDWVPARPPKKPHLRVAYAPPNPPSPDLPPPSPPPVEEEVFISDEPLPPPPSEDQFEYLTKQPQQHSPSKQQHHHPYHNNHMVQCQPQQQPRSQYDPSSPQALKHMSPTYVDNKSPLNHNQEGVLKSNEPQKYNSSSQLLNSDRVVASPALNSSTSKRSPNTYYENQIDMLRQSLQKSLPTAAEPQTRVVNQERESPLDNHCHLHNRQEPSRRSSRDQNHHHAQSYNQNSPAVGAGQVNTSSAVKDRLRSLAPTKPESFEVISSKNGIDRLQDCSTKVGSENNINESNKLTEGIVPVTQRTNTCWKPYNMSSDHHQFHQPRSLDSNLLINDSRYETHNSKPGPQTPSEKTTPNSGGHLHNSFLAKSYSVQKTAADLNLKARVQNQEVATSKPINLRKDSFGSKIKNGANISAASMDDQGIQSPTTGFASIKNVFQQCSERNSFRFSTAAQKLLVDGKIANAVQKGTISPTHRYAPSSIGSSSSQFQRASIRRSKIEQVPAATVHSQLLQLNRSSHKNESSKDERRSLPPTLPPQCPPTSHQRSQSKASAYLAYRREPRERERGLPNFTGSYKRTMSPSGGQIKSLNNLENQDTIKDKSTAPLSPAVVDNTAIEHHHLNNNSNLNNNNIVNNHHQQTPPTTIITDKTLSTETKLSASPSHDRIVANNNNSNCQTSIVNIVNNDNAICDSKVVDNSSNSSTSTSSLSSLSSSSSSTRTLPRNYSLPANPVVPLANGEQQKRPALRTARTQSDPVNAATAVVAATPREISSSCCIIKSNSSCSSASINSKNSISIAINQNDQEPVVDSVEATAATRREDHSKVITVSNRIPSPTISVATSTTPDIEDNCNDNNEVTISSSEVSISCGGDEAEPLRLVQRTEVTLRVNAATTDAASQTEAGLRRTPSPPSGTPPQASSLLRLPLREEIECDQLSRDLATRLPPSHRLQGILAPGPEVKKCTDYVSGLFRLDLLPRSRTSLASSTTTTTEPSNCENVSESNEKVKEAEAVQNLSANSAYFTTSECKAKLLALCQNQTQSETASSSIGPNDNLYQKKEELMSRLSRKLVVLRAEAVAVAEECGVNEALGEAVGGRVAALARPHEAAKLRLHIKEVGHITSLLLGLSGRLARAENALLGLATDHPERKILEEKRDKLRAQLEEAKQLKVSIDRRSGSVSTMLYKYLSAEEYADYDHFIGMKAKLLIDSREIDDKIKLGEEQLAALQEMLDDSSIAR